MNKDRKTELLQQKIESMRKDTVKLKEENAGLKSQLAKAQGIINKENEKTEKLHRELRKKIAEYQAMIQECEQIRKEYSRTVSEMRGLMKQYKRDVAKIKF